MAASIKEALSAPRRNGVSQTIIERNPDYDSWEAERIALVLRQQELFALVDGVSEAAAEAAYLRAETDGFDDSYCQQQADAVRSQLRELRDEQTRLNSRLSIIKPFVTQERVEKNSTRDEREEFKSQILGYLDRITSAVERIARATA